MLSNFKQLLAHASGGRRYCFVVMSYHEKYAFFGVLKRIVAEETGFECLRADDISAPGENIRDKIHAAIESAVFILADITDPRANIFYEIGFAIARNKPVLLLIQKGVEPVTDLKGIELISYEDNREGWPAFEQELRKHLRLHQDSSVSLLRAMIIPPDPEPSYLILNPKKPQLNSSFPRHPFERRTYGDYLGVSGVLNAFSSVYGEHHAPEIVSASHADPEIINWDANLFLIGSPKVNPFTEHFLSTMQGSSGANWNFSSVSSVEPIDDYEVQLTGKISSGEFKSPIGTFKDNTQLSDYGLILRGPHPKFPKRTVIILAGPHSLGTGAACLAATKSQLVSDIGKALTGVVDLATRDRTLWILLKAAIGPDDHIDSEQIKIVEAGAY